MVKFFPNRHWGRVQCSSICGRHILAAQSCTKHPEPTCCCSGPVWLQPPPEQLQARPGVTLTHWFVFYSCWGGRAGARSQRQPHLTCSSAERLVSSPAAQLSYCIFLSSHSWVNSLVKRAKGLISEIFLWLACDTQAPHTAAPALECDPHWLWLHREATNAPILGIREKEIPSVPCQGNKAVFARRKNK